MFTRLETLLECDHAYQEKYDVAGPTQVSAFDIAEPDDHDALEAIWTDINDWLTIREDQRVLEHAHVSSANSIRPRRSICKSRR